jgi:hypothetical protein
VILKLNFLEETRDGLRHAIGFFPIKNIFRTPARKTFRRGATRNRKGCAVMEKGCALMSLLHQTLQLQFRQTLL